MVRRHRYWIIFCVLAAAVVIGGWHWQAWTTEKVGLCYHAHFRQNTWLPGPTYDESGNRRGTRDSSTEYNLEGNQIENARHGGLRWLRHYHGRLSVTGQCAFRHKEKLGDFFYSIYEFGSSSKWSEEPGNYVIANHTDSKLVAIYVGQTANLRESLTNLHRHKFAACIEANNPTHIHAHRSSTGERRRIKETDELIKSFSPTCNRD